MRVYFLTIVAFVHLLSFFTGCQNSGEDPIPEDSILHRDTITEIDSTKIYPKCIADTSSAGQFGCSNMFFGRVMKGDLLYPDEVITIAIDPEIVTITRECQTFILPANGFNVLYLESGYHPDSIYFSYCTENYPDILGTPKSYELMNGQITVAANKDTITPEDDFFWLSAELLNAQFRISETKDTTIQSIKFNEILQAEFE